MIKLAGICFVLVSTTLIGFGNARRLHHHIRQLRQLQSALQILEAEISYGQAPLQMAFKRIATQVSAPTSIFFETLAFHLVAADAGISEIFQRSLDTVWHKTALQTEEYEVLKQFGETLGKHDRFTEQQQIKVVLTHLSRIEQEAIDRQRTYAKMYQSLGVLSGLLVVVLLI